MGHGCSCWGTWQYRGGSAGPIPKRPQNSQSENGYTWNFLVSLVSLKISHEAEKLGCLHSLYGSGRQNYHLYSKYGGSFSS